MTTIKELRKAYRAIKARPNVRTATNPLEVRAFGKRAVTRADAIAIVLGVPVSYLDVRAVVNTKAIPNDATIEVVDEGKGACRARLSIRWTRASGGRGGLSLVTQQLGALQCVTVL